MGATSLFLCLLIRENIFFSTHKHVGLGTVCKTGNPRSLWQLASELGRAWISHPLKSEGKGIARFSVARIFIGKTIVHSGEPHNSPRIFNRK